MTFILTLRKNGKILRFTPKMLFSSYFNGMWYKESYIRAPVILNLFHTLRKRDKMLGNPAFYFLPQLVKFNESWALIKDPLFNSDKFCLFGVTLHIMW